MIFVKISGGLGNQMFQYACGRSLAAKHGVELVLDCSFYENVRRYPFATQRKFELDIFTINAKVLGSSGITTRIMMLANGVVKKLADIAGLKKLSRSVYQLEDANSDPLTQSSWNCILNGYWQSEDYFREKADIIRNDFRFLNEPEGNNKDLASRIYKTNSVSIHIRRGDYISDAATNKTHGICSLEYYANAVKFIAGKVPDPVFYIFSDDMEWVKSNLLLSLPHEYIEGNNQHAAYVDMQLMTMCNHNIIANSSFSWWAAWLNPNDKKIVVAPKKWFADPSLHLKSRQLIPANWITL